MFIAMNRFQIALGFEEGFEAVWRYRSALLEGGWTRVAQYLFHKVLRWLTPLLLIALLAVSFQGRDDPLLATALVLQGLFYALALTGLAVRGAPRAPTVVRIPFHFCLVNAAALKGLVDFLRRRQQTIWEKSESTRRP